MQITLRDIAKKSGYSVTTVSRALAGYNDVNEATRTLIIDIATSMGYQPNLVARHLRHQRTNTIGLIIPSNDIGFSDDFFSELMMGVGHAASEHGYDVLISAQASFETELDAYRRIVGGNRVDGMVLARTRKDDPRIEYLHSISHPFVVSGRRSLNEENDFAFIDVDSQLGIKMLVDHFVELGHREIALLLPPAEMAFTDYRLEGYKDSLKQAGIPFKPEYVVCADLKRRGGYEATRRLLGQFPQLTAFVGCNDLMALGAMSAIQDRGYRVGDQIVVGGFDDIPAAEYSSPPLTTVRQPIYEIGVRLMNMLIQIVQGFTPERSQILLEPALVVRESCGSKR